MCPVEGATVAGVPTYRACLVDVFDTAISIDMPRYNAALAREAHGRPGRLRRRLPAVGGAGDGGHKLDP